MRTASWKQEQTEGVPPHCTIYATCVAHCNNCKEGVACNLHTAAQLSAKCTRTRLCAEHA